MCSEAVVAQYSNNLFPLLHLSGNRSTSIVARKWSPGHARCLPPYRQTEKVGPISCSSLALEREFRRTGQFQLQRNASSHAVTCRNISAQPTYQVSFKSGWIRPHITRFSSYYGKSLQSRAAEWQTLHQQPHLGATFWVRKGKVEGILIHDCMKV
jgi:hypothetical protein